MDAPWSTKGAAILDADHSNATEWSAYVKPIIKYNKAYSLLTTPPTDEQATTVAQLILFLTQTIHHTLHSVIVDDDPIQTWAAIQALKPNNAARLEHLANNINSMSLADTTASEYVTAHRAANTTSLSIDPAHRYSQPHTYLQRVLAGLKSSPNMSALILHYRNMREITTTTINTIFTDIVDATPDLNHIASSTRHARNATNQHRVRHHQNPRIRRKNYGRERGLPGVDYA
jgi:hypothetical protein